MVSKFIAKRNFYFSFFEKQVVPSPYKTLTYSGHALPVSEYRDNFKNTGGTPVLCVELFPSYFDAIIEVPPGVKVEKIFRINGFCINIGDTQDINSYIKANIKSNLRTVLKRKTKGLETSFDIRYKLYYGQINKEDYDFLMQSLHGMLTRRFNQRDDQHESLKRWDSYVSSVFDLIHEKKASLYVIYDDQKPIQISLNYHCDKIVFLAIPSYDIDYAKFGLGNIAVQKILEWSINNGYKILDMGYGAFDYKLKWCNHTYTLEHHLFYQKGSYIAPIIVGVISLKTRLVNFLVSKGVNKFYHSLRSKFSKKPETGEIEYYLDETFKELSDYTNHKRIDFMNHDSYSFLKKPVYDFLYTNLEHIAKVEVYEVQENLSYVIKGPKNIQKIVFKR
ncbi:GNAT family N-acetyltransferase [Sediminicola sp. 1XM1-17]|uniref:GNAT family N-acetyltransferase n=1 Tax=Sediminicola sp. 1XM1-17 TaxID=3127702 RepID=UPI00307804E5